MSIRGIYAYEDGTESNKVYSAFMRWGNPQESSLNLAQYSFNISAFNLVYGLGMTPNLDTRKIPEQSFFTKDNRFWVPHILTPSVGNPMVQLFCYHGDEREDVAEYLGNYPDSIPGEKEKTLGGLHLDMSFYGDCNYSIIYQPGREDHTNFVFFDSLEELEKQAGKVYDLPEFAYIYHERESEWQCHPLKTSKHDQKEADMWNRRYSTNKQELPNYDAILDFSEEVLGYIDDFEETFHLALETIEDLEPSILERTLMYANAELILKRYFDDKYSL